MAKMQHTIRNAREVERGEEEMYIVVILQIITYVLFILALILTHDSERKQYDLNKKVVAKFKQENDSLRHENEELKITEIHIKKIISSYETNNTNPYTLARDIKKELVSDYQSLN